MTTEIKLTSSDGKHFTVDYNLMSFHSTFIKQMFEFCPGDENENNKPKDELKLERVTSGALEKIIEWVNHHKLDHSITQWDIRFMDMDQYTLCALIKAANFLDMEVLHTHGCKAVADMLIGKSTEEMRATFGIKEDL